MVLFASVVTAMTMEAGGYFGPLVALFAVWYSSESTVGLPQKAFLRRLPGQGAVAQLVRVPDCRSGGCGFESRPRR